MRHVALLDCAHDWVLDARSDAGYDSGEPEACRAACHRIPGRVAPRNEKLTRNLTEARMRVGDVPLVSLIDMISVLINQAPEKAMGPVVGASLSSGGQSPIEPILEALRFVRRVRAALDQLERESGPYFQIGLSST